MQKMMKLFSTIYDPIIKLRFSYEFNKPCRTPASHELSFQAIALARENKVLSHQTLL